MLRAYLPRILLILLSIPGICFSQNFGNVGGLAEYGDLIGPLLQRGKIKDERGNQYSYYLFERVHVGDEVGDLERYKKLLAYIGFPANIELVCGELLPGFGDRLQLDPTNLVLIRRVCLPRQNSSLPVPPRIALGSGLRVNPFETSGSSDISLGDPVEFILVQEVPSVTPTPVRTPPVPPTATPTPRPLQCLPPVCPSPGVIVCPAASCPNGCGLICRDSSPTPTRTPVPSATTPPPMCTPPPCDSVANLVCPNSSCPNGCGLICRRATPTAVPTTPAPVCTPPPCPSPGGRLICPNANGCPAGCGLICRTLIAPGDGTVKSLRKPLKKVKGHSNLGKRVRR